MKSDRELIEEGYRRISRRYGRVARTDRKDWPYHQHQIDVEEFAQNIGVQTPQGVVHETYFLFVFMHKYRFWLPEKETRGLSGPEWLQYVFSFLETCAEKQ